MKKQKKLIHMEDWDNLIILDACRFDYFKEIYKKYLDGRLFKVRSPASHTLEWCKKVFKNKNKEDEYSDCIYISANPFIRSSNGSQGFNANKVFRKIVDVWDEGWNEELGTAHPRVVNKDVLDMKEFFQANRFIIHYMQPHDPYINFSLPEEDEGQREFLWKFGGKITRTLLTPIIKKITGREIIRPVTQGLQRVFGRGLYGI